MPDWKDLIPGKDYWWDPERGVVVSPRRDPPMLDGEIVAYNPPPEMVALAKAAAHRRSRST